MNDTKYIGLDVHQVTISAAVISACTCEAGRRATIGGSAVSDWDGFTVPPWADTIFSAVETSSPETVIVTNANASKTRG